MEHFLREPWRTGKPALGIWNAIGNTLLAELVASTGPDYVCVDMQHGGAHDGMLLGMLQGIVSGGSVPLVRVRENNAASITYALDAGARGVIVPLVESGDEAARAVAACRFPPKGVRSFGPFRASLHTDSTDHRELENVACIVMIETTKGIQQLEEIASTEGLTGVYLGPSDLSLALGLKPGSADAPEFVAVLRDILDSCAAHGLIAGLHCYGGDTALRAIKQGFRMVTVAVDLRLLRRAVLAELSTVRGACA